MNLPLSRVNFFSDNFASFLLHTRLLQLYDLYRGLYSSGFPINRHTALLFYPPAPVLSYTRFNIDPGPRVSNLTSASTRLNGPIKPKQIFLAILARRSPAAPNQAETNEREDARSGYSEA